MATSISGYNSTPASNTTIDSISIAEGWAAADINNAIRALMSHLADAYAGDAAWDSVTDSITAGSTQTQAGATELTTIVNRVTVVGTDDDGVKLPSAVAGISCLVINDGANAAQIWPNTSDKIDGGSADAVDANTLAAGSSRRYVAIDATNWYTSLSDATPTSLLSAKPFVAVYRSAATENVTGNGTEYTVTWNTEIVDTGGDFASNTFTAPTTGWYRVEFHVAAYGIATSLTNLVCRIKATGQNYDIGGESPSSGAPSQYRISPSRVIKMTAADTFTITVIASGIGADSVDLDGGLNNSGLTVEFLGNA